MKMRVGILILCLTFSLINCYETDFKFQITPNRVLRAINNKKHSNECRYEKEAWDQCDTNTGQQRRVLRLKASRSTSNECEPEKFIERPCKKNCRYSKGVWSECNNGTKTRTDLLKGSQTIGCEQTRNVTKTCKEQCNYQKSEWSVCENGVKSKTLTLQNDSGANTGCEPTKIIRKQCGHNRQNRKEKMKTKKSNFQNSAQKDN